MLKHLMIVLCCLSPSVAPAQSGQPESIEDWTLVCPSAEGSDARPNCHLSQTIQSENGQFTLLIASITLRADDQLVLILTTPLGIDLASGLKWQIDTGRKRQFVFNTCTHDGCFAAIPLNSKTIADLRRGLDLQVRYNDGAANKVKPTISLRGFSAGIEALKVSANSSHE